MMNRSDMRTATAMHGPRGSHSIVEQQPIRDAISDGVITAKVKLELQSHAITAAHEIHVDTVDGIVELSGFVETSTIAAAAVLLAQNVEGVQNVNDAMDVRNTD